MLLSTLKNSFLKRSSNNFLPFLFCALVLAVVLYVRFRLLTVPLERDEGEFAYMGQLLLKGIPPFSHAYTMKLPGVSIMYAFFMLLFGQTPAGIHTGLLIVNLLCIYMVYLLTKRLLDPAAAMFSCAGYAVLSLSNSVSGVFAHATHFVLLFILTGFLLLLRSFENRRISILFVSGLCFGLAVAMKQHAVIPLIFAMLYFLRKVLRNRPSDRRICVTGSFIFLLGTVIPYSLIVLWMLASGNFSDFWFWTVQYAREYAATPPLSIGWNRFTSSFGTIFKSQLPMWLLAGTGCVLLGIKKRYSTDRYFLFGFMLFSFLGICPGLFFRGHYFILLLPAVAIIAGAVISSTRYLPFSNRSARFAPFMPVFLFVAAVTYCLNYEKETFFMYTPQEVSRSINGANPFPEALKIANYIKSNTTPGEQIAVLGSEPEIYFYADRLSATGYIYMYGLMEDQPYASRMQAQMISEIEAAHPKYVVVVNVSASWVVQKTSVRSVLHWGERYVTNLYDLVGVIDIIDSVTTLYMWGDNAANYTPLSETFVTVFKRKTEG